MTNAHFSRPMDVEEGMMMAMRQAVLNRRVHELPDANGLDVANVITYEFEGRKETLIGSSWWNYLYLALQTQYWQGARLIMTHVTPEPDWLFWQGDNFESALSPVVKRWLIRFLDNHTKRLHVHFLCSSLFEDEVW